MPGSFAGMRQERTAKPAARSYYHAYVDSESPAGVATFVATLHQQSSQSVLEGQRANRLYWRDKSTL